MEIMLALSVVAGVLTVLAPCVLPLLPVIIGGSSIGGNARRPWLIAASLAVSVIAFTLLLKATTSLLGVPQLVWQMLSGGILIAYGASILLPTGWAGLAGRLGLPGATDQLARAARSKDGAWGDVLLGAALGPVFNSCSPTYAVIVAVVLPARFGEGLVYLIAYAGALAATLLVLALAGRALVRRLGWITNPRGIFHKAVGILLICVGVSVILGFDKFVQAYVLQQGWYDGISSIEARFFGQ